MSIEKVHELTDMLGRAWPEPYSQTTCPTHGTIQMVRREATPVLTRCPLCGSDVITEYIEPSAKQRRAL